MLFSAGEDLRELLKDGGLLQEQPCKDGVGRLCTCTGRVRATFQNLACVIVSREATYYRNCRHGPICTCTWFCRYAGCEHVTFAKFLNLRLLPADPAERMTLTAPQRRGRPVGVKKVTHKTPRGKTGQAAGAKQKTRKAAGAKQKRR